MLAPLILKGWSIVLREVTEGDLAVLHKWRNDPRFQKFCSGRTNTVTLEEFRREIIQDFKSGRSIQFLILREDKPIGTIFDYGLSNRDGYTFFTTFLIPEVESKGYGAEAVHLFLHYIFVNYNLYKVYAEVYEYNTKPLGMLKKGGFVEEGRFRGHRLYEGKRYSLLRLAYFREQFPELEAFLKKKLRVKVE